jgi:hypothetical protein
MLDLPTSQSQLAALKGTLPDGLKPLLCRCIRHAADQGLADLTHVLVIEPGDTETMIIDAIGFTPLASRIDGIRLQADFDSISHEQEHGWFRLLYLVGDSGFAFLLFIRDDPGVPSELLDLCRRGVADST